MGIGNIDVGLNAMTSIAQALAAAKSSSLIEYTKPMRVEPIALVDRDCVHYEGVEDVMQSLLSLFSGYYLMAVALSSQIGNVSVMGKLGPLNPQRDPITEASLTGFKLLTMESYQYALPRYGDKEIKPVFESFYDPVLSSNADDDPGQTTQGSKLGVNDKAAADLGKTIAESANMSVGKILSVEITDGRCKMNIPVNVRLLVNLIPTQSLISILSEGHVDKSWKARWHGWRSGRLDSIKDMIFCQDLIDAHRKKLMGDSEGIYGNIIDRKRKNQLSAILSGTPSVATASNLVVMSRETLNQIQATTDADFSRFDNREKFFSETSLMIIAVIDKQRDRVIFYHRSIPTETDVSIRSLKSANKSGVDVKDVLQAYSLGAAPSL
jgi:hypothetical protein